MIVDIDNPVLADMSDAELENYFAPRAAYTVVRGHADTRRQVPWGDLLPDEQAAIVGELLLARRAFEMNRGRYPVTQEARVVFRPLAALSDPERAAAERGLRQCAADLQAESAEITQSLRPRDGR